MASFFGFDWRRTSIFVLSVLILLRLDSMCLAHFSYYCFIVLIYQLSLSLSHTKKKKELDKMWWCDFNLFFFVIFDEHKWKSFDMQMLDRVPSKELWTVKIPKSVNAPARISRWNLWSSFLFWEIENIWWLFLHMELKKEVDCVKIFTSS